LLTDYVSHKNGQNGAEPDENEDTTRRGEWVIAAPVVVHYCVVERK
jgi:hypothetical protein